MFLIISILFLVLGLTIRSQDNTQEKIEKEVEQNKEKIQYTTSTHYFSEEKYYELIKAIIKDKQTITATELAQILEISTQKASYYLRKLENKKELYAFRNDKNCREYALEHEERLQLSKWSKEVYDVIFDYKAISAEDISKILNRTTRSINANITDLQKKGLVTRYKDNMTYKTYVTLTQKVD